MEKLAVVYFPQIDLGGLHAFRKKYDPNWQIIPPHITVVSPVSDISESQLIEHVEKVMKDIPTFSIHLTGLTKTADDCLFLLVAEGNEKIIQLHARLYRGILKPYVPTDFPYIPHITLGEAKAYAEAEVLHFDITCTLDAVCVIKGDGVSPAKTIKTIQLQR